jgi:hypothetical protein
MKKDKYRREMAKEAMDTDGLKAFAREVLRGIDDVDLKSLSFDKDPDCLNCFCPRPSSGLINRTPCSVGGHSVLF